MLLAIIGDCGYWPYTLGRSVRLYTNGCVVDSGMGLWDHAVLPLPFGTLILVQLSMIAGEYTLSSDLA